MAKQQRDPAKEAYWRKCREASCARWNRDYRRANSDWRWLFRGWNNLLGDYWGCRSAH